MAGGGRGREQGGWALLLRPHRSSDGSAWVEAPIRGHSSKSACLRIRELRALGLGPDRERFTLRLWTTLADPRHSPAEVLARRYALRWRHELYHRDLKLDVHHVPERTTHDFETAAQEIAALLLGSWVLAQERLALAQRRGPAPSWVSFLQLMRATETLWSVFQMLGSTLSQAQRQRALAYYMASVRAAIGRPDRGASSPHSPLRGRKSGAALKRQRRTPPVSSDTYRRSMRYPCTRQQVMRLRSAGFSINCPCALKQAVSSASVTA